MFSSKVSPDETGVVHVPEKVNFSGTLDKTSSLGRPSSLRLQDHLSAGIKSHPESEGSQIKEMEEKVMMNEPIAYSHDRSPMQSC